MEGHSGIKDFSVQIIDVTDVKNPTERQSFLIEKLNTYIPMGHISIQLLSKRLSKANIPKYLNTDHVTAISMRQLAGLLSRSC